MSTPPLRVLVVTVVHDPEDARIRHRELRALLDGGCVVTYAAPFTGYARAVPEGLIGIDLPRAVGRRRGAALLAARRMLAREGPRHDVVVMHDPELLAAAAGAAMALRHSVVVWDVHEDTAAALGMKGWLPGPAQRMLPALVRGGERLAERAVRLTLAEDAYATRFAGKHPVVPNSVLVAEAEPPPPGRDRVVYLGRLTRARGALELIELGRLLAPDVRLELVGPCDPDMTDLLNAADASGDVRWHGFLPNTEALGLLPGSLAGLSLLHDEPNYAHSRPTKLMEYMASGIPVITTPNPVSVELVSRYDCGLVVPFEDTAAVASAVRRLRDDDALRDGFGRRGREAALAELDWRLDGRRFVAQLQEWSAAR